MAPSKGWDRLEWTDLLGPTVQAGQGQGQQPGLHVRGCPFRRRWIGKSLIIQVDEAIPSQGVGDINLLQEERGVHKPPRKTARMNKPQDASWYVISELQAFALKMNLSADVFFISESLNILSSVKPQLKPGKFTDKGQIPL